MLLGAAAVLCGAVAVASCTLASLVAYGLAADGLEAFAPARWALLPAGAFLAVAAAGALAGLRSLGRQLASSRRLERRVARLGAAPPPALARLAAEARLGGSVRVIDSPEPFSFAYGAWRPRVVVSRGLIDCASAAELRAVLVHERYHVRNRDPLKVVLARTASAAFFLVPALRELERRYLAGRELAADRRAARACGRRPLAGALLKVVRGPAWPELSSAAAIGGSELLAARVAQLESGREPDAGLSRRAVALSAAALALLAASFAGALVGLHGAGVGSAASRAGIEGGAAVAAMDLGCAVPLLMGGWLAWTWHRA